jgi:hypothetical protein
MKLYCFKIPTYDDPEKAATEPIEAITTAVENFILFGTSDGKDCNNNNFDFVLERCKQGFLTTTTIQRSTTKNNTPLTFVVVNCVVVSTRGFPIPKFREMSN